jgi:hypothetical protein
MTVFGLLGGFAAAYAALGIPLSAVEGIASGHLPQFSTFTPASGLVRIASDVIQAFAILAGLIAQIIALVTMVFNPGRLAVKRVRQISVALEKMQAQLLALFAFYVITLAFALATKVLAEPGERESFSNHAGPICLAATAFWVVFCLARTVDLGTSIMSVQKLRTKLLVQQAKEDASDPQSKTSQPIEPDPTPEAYGTTSLQSRNRQ